MSIIRSDPKRKQALPTSRLNRPSPVPTARGSELGSRHLTHALVNPNLAPSTALIALQNGLGNRAVQRLISRSAQTLPAVGPDGGEAEPEIQRQIENTQTGGYRLDQTTQDKFGPALGADFGNVRIHTDDRADHLNRSLSAKAFTHGNHVYFTKGAYNPQSENGQKLIAHELTHVVQQGQAKPNRAGAVQRTVSSDTGQGVIQRYSVVQPENYTRRVRGKKAAKPQMFNEMFLKQRLDTSVVDDLLNNERTYNLNSEEGHFEQKPPLKVSQNGLLAMEHTTDQPKVFYADSTLVQSSRNTLEDIGSMVTLEPHTNKKLKVPKTPDAPVEGQVNELIMVSPAKSDPMSVALMDANQCDAVASKIIGSSIKTIAIGKDLTFYPDSFRMDDTGTLAAKSLNSMKNGDTAYEFSSNFKKHAKPEPELTIDKGIRKKFQKIIKAGGISDFVLTELSHPRTPDHVIEQVYQAHKGKKTATRPRATPIVNYIKSHRDIPALKKYGETYRSDTIPPELGLNKDAEPEVGEAFSIVRSGEDVPLVDDNGVYEGNLDFTSTSSIEQGNALGDLQNIQGAGQKLNYLRASIHTNFKRGMTFNEHHAAVVAKDASDTVTFENYNRAVELRNLFGQTWDRLAGDFPEFNAKIQDDIEEVRQDTDSDPQIKLYNVREAKKRELLKLKNNLTATVGLTSVQLQTNLDTKNKNAMWYFGMYGPKNKLNPDNTKQSFNEVWENSIANPVTVRTTAALGVGSRTEFKRKAQEAVDHKKQPLDDKDKKRESLDLLLSITNTFLDGAETMPEASNIYRKLLKDIAKY